LKDVSHQGNIEYGDALYGTQKHTEYYIIAENEVFYE
jgi:hypothetical protein